MQWKTAFVFTHQTALHLEAEGLDLVQGIRKELLLVIDAVVHGRGLCGQVQ